MNRALDKIQVVRETEPDFEGILDKAAARLESKRGFEQQAELLTLHLLHLARCRDVICEKKTSSSPYHIRQKIHAMTYGWLEEPISVPKRVIY